jgi:zinc D-Ala-D-Ala carboxypeptidase
MSNTNNNWEFFTEDELKCKGTGRCEMNEGFMNALVRLRKVYGKPMAVSSGFRDPSYNKQIGGADNSAHIYGKAVDIRVSGVDAWRIVNLAMQGGFTGIGVKQKGPVNERFIHLDTMSHDDGSPRPAIWSY